MMGKRTLVIGDIHSGLKALQQVLERAGATPEDRLIFLGDYVDGWSQAAPTVDYLIYLKGTHDCVFLRGNHDELCWEWLVHGADNPTWLQHGGRATMASYQTVDDEKVRAHIAFFESLENHYLDASNRLFLHAGFTNLRGIGHEYFTKTFYWDRTLWELAKAVDPQMPRDHARYPPRLRHYAEIFIGHTPISKTGPAVPGKAASIWNMDTGAAFKGALSLMDVDTKQYWQSDPVWTLYPGERGRNQK